MATSLASQLKRLEAPQTSVFKTRKGRYSFLYSQDEAMGIGCDTHYSIALDGLTDLIELDPGLEQYRNSLLNESSKSFERGVRGREENEKLDEEMECFLLRLITPHFIRVDCHKVLEYLIYKYRVNEFNTDTLIMAAMPYHGTSLFPKLLQAIPKFCDTTKKWSFLKCVQEQGSPITRSVLVNRCLSEQWLLQLITDTARKEVSVSGGGAGRFSTFATSIFLGCQISAGENENVLTAVQCFIDAGLSSTNRYFVLSAYTVASFACSKVKFVETFVTKLMSRACRKFRKYEFRVDIVEEFVLFVAVVLNTQQVEASSTLPDSAVSVMTEYADLIIQTPHVVNTLIRKLASPVTEQSLPQILKLLSASKSIERRTVALVEKSLRPFNKTKQSTATRVQILQVILRLLRTGYSSVKKLKSMARDGESMAILIDQITLVGGEPGQESSHRIPLNLKNQEWKDVTALLELATGPRITESGPLLEQCQLLLRESLAYEEEADLVYYRRLLLRNIHQIITADDFDWTGEKSPMPDTSCIIDMMKAFRNQEGVKECLKIIKQMAAHKRTEILENYMRVFSFVGCKYGDCDDKVSLSLMDMILCDLVPTLTAGDEGLIRKVIDSLIISIYSVATHRRLVILNRFLQVIDMGDEASDYVAFSLLLRSLRGRSDKTRKFYCQFCAQFLSSLKLADANRYLEQLFGLLLECLLESDAASSPSLSKTAKGKSGQKEFSFPSLVSSLKTDPLIQKENVFSTVAGILIKTLASDEYVSQTQQQRGTIIAAESGTDQPDTHPVIEGMSDSSSSFMQPIISKLVDHIIACHEKGKVFQSAELIHELIQNATLSSPVTTFMSMAARLLQQSSRASNTEGMSSNFELTKVAISIIWMNRDRITEWQDRDNQLLFQCVDSLARISCVLLATLSSSLSVTTATCTLSPTGKESARGKGTRRQRSQSLQFEKSSLSMLKFMLRELGEVSEAEQRSFLDDKLLVFLDWIDAVMANDTTAAAAAAATAKPAQRKESPHSLVPWVTLAATQIMKSLGSKDGKKHVPRFLSTLSVIQKSGLPLVVESGKSSMSVIVQLFPDAGTAYKLTS